MPNTISAVKARQNFGSLLNQVFYKKKEIVIERAGRKMGVIVPLEKYKKWKSKKEQLISSVYKIKKELSKTSDGINRLLEEVKR